MQAPRWLVRFGLYPLHERLRGRATASMVRQMRRRDRWSRSRMQEFHDQKLCELLRWAADTVPFYRAHVRADSVNTADDLLRFPLLSKDTIRSGFGDLKSDRWRGKILSLETGGSSGEPLRFLSDPIREASQLACKGRSRAWFGLHSGSRETDLWGSPIELAKNAGLRARVAGAMGFQLLPAFRMNDAVMGTFRDRLARGRADFLYGYASSLAHYARFLEARNEDVLGLGIRLAICTAESLLPDDRAVIERRIAPVANEYGCRDGGLIAHEDPEGLLRVQHDAVHIEILSETGEPVPDGEEGEVAVTNLWARAFPLIRYRIGDRAVRASRPASDTLPHPVLERVAGRSTDFLVAQDGTRVHALGVIYVLREIPGVLKFRVTQTDREHLEVLIVASSDLDQPATSARVSERIRRVLGDRLSVAVRFVDQMDPLPSGKHRYVICEVPG